MNKIYLSGPAISCRVGSRLNSLVASTRPRAMGMATAFLSIGGARRYHALFCKSGARVSRVVAGLSGSITHPAAISHLIDVGHNVRFGTFAGGIFHPKLLVGGNRFDGAGKLSLAVCGYVGSANFTHAGLARNLEVMLTTHDREVASGVAQAFCEIWANATPVTKRGIRAYEHDFARAQRKRAVADLEFLSVVDIGVADRVRPTLVLPTLCSAVWVGLQTFTGEHTFQVEFPKKAGEALGSLLGTDSGEVQVECSDGTSRRMAFRYYVDNGMYRLNVPNHMPLVDWARNNHGGALLVWRDDDESGDALNAAIIRGRHLRDCVARSRALGSWGRTSTREYGWY